ncbi:MAG: flagellar hook-associated protein FlgK [Afipia sp.]|nr:flagellar hook-associated protein FlgK [Afipia sp.]
MGLSQALSTAMSGLRANQAAMSLVSSNVANAETPGYVRKTTNQVQMSTGTGVQTIGVNRTLNEYIQAQLRTETSGASYASTRASFLNNLQSIYGDPGSSSTLEGSFNALTSALQALSTSPDSQSARIGVMNAAQSMAQQLNATSQGIQGLRNSAELGLTNAVSVANNALSQIASINRQLQGNTGQDASTAAMLDQRDQYITQLSQLMDVRVVPGNGDQVSVYTMSGVQLVGGSDAVQLSFNAQGTVTPNTQWNADPAKSSLGSISISYANGGSIDLISSGSIRSGAIAAYLELRDESLVQAQAQVDQLAAAMASALSDRTTSGTAYPPASPAPPPGTPAGFDLDLSGLQSGNVVNLTYTDTITNTKHSISIIRVDDPSVLPLKDNATIDPNDKVIGVDFSGGMASVLTQLNAALGGAGVQFSNPSGSTLRVLDDGAGGKADINAASVTKTATSLNGGGPELPLFTDGGHPYSGTITATGSQQTGLAGRISVNSGLLADPSRLVVYGTGTPAGDTTRSDYILSQLKSGSFSYSASTGVGSNATPYKGTLLGFTQQFTSLQGNVAASAQLLSDGQDVVLNTLQKKMDSVSGVDIDEEMANLLALQNAYSANARVMSTINSMFQSLMQVI